MELEDDIHNRVYAEIGPKISESSKANFTLVDKVEYAEIKQPNPIEEQHCESGNV